MSEEDVVYGRERPDESHAAYRDLPRDVQDALRAADKVTAILQKHMPASAVDDGLMEAYDELAFLLYRIGVPRVP